MRIHAVGLPHSRMNGRDNPDCAFTQRLLRWSQMMTARGHEVFLYGCDAESWRARELCTEFIECMTPAEWERWFDRGTKHGLDTDVRGVPTFNRRVIKGMRERMEPEDFILLTWGRPQLPVAKAFPNNIAIEGAIGYGDRVLPYAVFDTYTWMHYMYGKQGIDQGKFFDAAILGPFNPDQFLPAAPWGHFDGEPYLLHIARLTPLKGLSIAMDLAERVDMNLVVCGGGDESLLTGDRVKYVGVVDHERRAELLQGAVALVAPTLYIEPGGQVVVEAAMAGVPAITTDFGCFLETNRHGWRCHLMSEFMIAALQAKEWDVDRRRELQLWAREEYGYQWVGQQWDDYLIRLHRLHGPGFYG